ncbi:MAG: ATP-binding protein [Candidatus Omnitrophica bacterium]|nr:ATP-binding protein [Candidatus Omnitrophota bacterium]
MEAQSKLQYEIQLLDTICRGLQETLNVDKIIHIVLTGLTAGASLGFSRAAIFFISESGFIGEGRGIGPYDHNEAGKIWAELTDSSVTLEEMFENSHRRTLESQRFPVEIKTMKLEIAKLPPESPLKKVIFNNEIVVLRDSERFTVPEEFHWFVRHATEVVIAPIVISGKVSAIIFADNAFHYKHITPETISFLSIVLNQAGLALANAFAYETVKRNLEQLRQLNEQLRKTQEELLACERFAAAGRISTYLAHEIRNPLVTIGGFAGQILEICKDKKIDPRISRNARIIVNEVRRLELVLNNLLRFSFKQPAKKQLIHLQSFLNELMEVLSINIEERQVKFSVEIPENIYVYADRIQLSEVFYNLIHNAIDSVKPGGSIVIKAGQHNKQVWIEISDTGNGIPEDVMKHLFKPFFTTKPHGMGLGLHLVKMIVEENHGGTIDVVSQLNTGTRIRFTIPEKEEHEKEENPSH